jgi:hypothetical protein
MNSMQQALDDQYILPSSSRSAHYTFMQESAAPATISMDPNSAKKKEGESIIRVTTVLRNINSEVFSTEYIRIRILC